MIQFHSKVIASTSSLPDIRMSTRQRRPSTTSTTELLFETAKNIERRVETSLTVLWDDLPSWQQDNHYIKSGYRPATSSFQKSFASLGYIHNESVNIYSHLIGAVVFTLSGFLLYAIIKPRYASAEIADVLAFSCFFAGAASCLGMSGTYHTISNHSPTVAKFGNKLDYLGIVSLITGSVIPGIYYGLYCHPHLFEFYCTVVSHFYKMHSIFNWLMIHSDGCTWRYMCSCSHA